MLTHLTRIGRVREAVHIQDPGRHFQLQERQMSASIILLQLPSHDTVPHHHRFLQSLLLLAT